MPLTDAQKHLFADYYDTFREGSGKRVLADLADLHESQLSYTKGDPYHTAFLEGARAVVLHIKQNMQYHKRPSLYDVEGELEE
jgi:hypothetical protein